MRHAVVEAIRNDPEWKNGDYEQQPHGFSRIVPLIQIMVSSPVRQYEKYPTRAAADAWYEQMTQGAYKHVDANDRLCQYDASSDYNPAPDLDKIKAKLLLILFEDDQINSPVFAALDREMPRVWLGRFVIVPAGAPCSGFPFSRTAMTKSPSTTVRISRTCGFSLELASTVKETAFR